MDTRKKGDDWRKKEVTTKKNYGNKSEDNLQSL